MKNNYLPEPYWNEVADKIAERPGINIIAGDDEPYYRYKRKQFLKLLHSISFKNKKVLELGPGPGGNLLEVLKQEPQELHGADVAQHMIDIARQSIRDKDVMLTKIDGAHLPYANAYFDLSFTSTVLQHNTDEDMLVKILNELCRVTKNELYLFEKIKKKQSGTALCIARPVTYYQQIVEANGFRLEQVKYLNIRISYLVCGTVRKLFNGNRKEGEKVSALTTALQNLLLPVTSWLDRLLNMRSESGMLYFKRNLANTAE